MSVVTTSGSNFCRLQNMGNIIRKRRKRKKVKKRGKQRKARENACDQVAIGLTLNLIG